MVLEAIKTLNEEERPSQFTTDQYDNRDVLQRVKNIAKEVIKGFEALTFISGDIGDQFRGTTTPAAKVKFQNEATGEELCVIMEPFTPGSGIDTKVIDENYQMVASNLISAPDFDLFFDHFCSFFKDQLFEVILIDNPKFHGKEAKRRYKQSLTENNKLVDKVSEALELVNDGEVQQAVELLQDAEEIMDTKGSFEDEIGILREAIDLIQNERGVRFDKGIEVLEDLLDSVQEAVGTRSGSPGIRRMGQVKDDVQEAIKLVENQDWDGALRAIQRAQEELSEMRRMAVDINVRRLDNVEGEVDRSRSLVQSEDKQGAVSSLTKALKHIKRVRRGEALNSNVFIQHVEDYIEDMDIGTELTQRAVEVMKEIKNMVHRLWPDENVGVDKIVDEAYSQPGVSSVLEDKNMERSELRELLIEVVPAIQEANESVGHSSIRSEDAVLIESVMAKLQDRLIGRGFSRVSAPEEWDKDSFHGYVISLEVNYEGTNHAVDLIVKSAKIGTTDLDILVKTTMGQNNIDGQAIENVSDETDAAEKVLDWFTTKFDPARDSASEDLGHGSPIREGVVAVSGQLKDEVEQALKQINHIDPESIDQWREARGDVWMTSFDVIVENTTREFLLELDPVDKRSGDQKEWTIELREVDDSGDLTRNRSAAIPDGVEDLRDSINETLRKLTNGFSANEDFEHGKQEAQDSDSKLGHSKEDAE